MFSEEDYAKKTHNSLVGIFGKDYDNEVQARNEVADAEVRKRFVALRILFDDMWRIQVATKGASMFSAIPNNSFNALPRHKQVMEALNNFFPQDITHRIYNHAKAGTIGNESNPLRDLLYVAITENPEVMRSYVDQPFIFLTDLAYLLWKDEAEGPWGVD